MYSINDTDGVGLNLKGLPIANSSYVDIDDISLNTAAAALLCWTNLKNCCKTSRRGEWYYPSGNIVGVMGNDTTEFYRDRDNEGNVRLNRRQDKPMSERGLFICEIPETDTVDQNLYINIGMSVILAAS